MGAGGLIEPAVVPRFLQALQDAGASPVRVDAYLTQQGTAPEGAQHELDLIRAGAVDAIVFTSTAEAQV
jgi:uroporphyrinogen-III synthase